jgi:hypothetical protein
MKRLFILIVYLLAATKVEAAGLAVYTGVLRYTNSSRVTLMRLFVIPKVHGPAPDIHMNLYLGGFDSNEMIPTYFDAVEVESDGSYVVSDKRNQYEGSPFKVPTLFLKKRVDGGLEGDLVSIENGIAANIDVIPGWSIREDMTQGKTLSSAFEGEYMASCHGYSPSRVVQLLELIATRFDMKDMAMVPGSDLTIKSVNYLGAMSCAPSMYPGATETNCGSFDRGNFDHYNNRLNLHLALNWQYSCQVSAEGDLDCEGPRRESCEFMRFKPPSASGLDVIGHPPTHVLSPVQSSASNIETSVGPCAELDGVSFGLLRHATTGLYQRVRLEARAREGSFNQEKGCQLIGAIKQHFNKFDDETIPPLTHVLSESWFVPSKGQGAIGASRVGGDAHITLERGDGYWKGLWYSSLFGYVGEVMFTKNPAIFPELALDQYVPSISGIFKQRPDHNISIERTISISGYPDTSDTSSFDPIRQVKLSGNLETTALDPNDDQGMSTLGGLEVITYNYFNGIATFLSPSAYYYMRVGWDKLDTKIITRRWGGNYMPVSWSWDFVRAYSPLTEPPK